MKSWLSSIVSYISGTNESRSNSPRDREVREMEAGEPNLAYAARYVAVPSNNNQVTTSSPRYGSNTKGKGKSAKRRHSSSSDSEGIRQGADGPLLPISMKDGNSPRGVLDPSIMTPSIKKHDKKSRSKLKHEKKKRHANKSKRTPIIEGLECMRPVATERCFMIKHQRQVYYIFHRESTAFKNLLNLIEVRLSELHRIRLLYWPARSNIDGTPVREALLHTLWIRVMMVEFETMRNSNTLTSTLFDFAMNAPAAVPYASDNNNSPRSSTLTTLGSSNSLLSSQTHLESMLPAPVPSSSMLQPQGVDGFVHKRRAQVPPQASSDTVITMGDDDDAFHPNLRDEDEDSGDGKIHKHRVDRKRQEALERRREMAKKQFPEQFQRFLVLPADKRLDAIKRLEAKRRSMSKGGRVVLRTGIGGDDTKKGDLDVLIRGMKAFVDDDSDASSDFSSSSSDHSDSGSESHSSSDDSDDESSSSSSNAQEMQSFNSGTQLQPLWLESACDNISSKEDLASDEVRKWYRHHYQSNINSWVAVDATIAYILLHQAGVAARDLGLLVQ